MRRAIWGLAVALAVGACSAEETPWEVSPDPAVRAAVVAAAEQYGEEVLVALPAFVPTGAFDSPDRTLDRAIRATDTWWVVLGADGRPTRMAAFTAGDGKPAQLAGTDWGDPEGIVAAAGAAGRDPRVVSAWGHVSILGERDEGIVAVPLGAGPIAPDPVPIAEYSDQLRGMSRGGGLGMDPAAAVALIAFFAFALAFPLLVLLGRAFRSRRR
ncbi:MAG TPA: hypothetical protein VES19_02320 [Candidatus Limnocylindrales bacterium]|nr:hypothetical protein [Candidatus Limnocylindrales bacterium]